MISEQHHKHNTELPLCFAQPMQYLNTSDFFLRHSGTSRTMGQGLIAGNGKVVPVHAMKGI
jgi:hypothetical protein